MAAEKILDLIVRPSKFFSDLSDSDSLLKGLAVFAVAVLISAVSFLYFYANKVRTVLVLGPFSNIELPLLPPDYVTMFSLNRLFLTVLFLLGISRVAAKFMRVRYDVNIKRATNATLYTFLTLAIITAASIPLLLAYPVQTYGIVGVSVEDVYIENASLTGVGENGSVVSIVDKPIRAQRLEVIYLDKDGNPIDWRSINPTDALEIINSSKPIMVLYDAATVGDVKLPKRIVAESENITSLRKIVYGRLSEVQQVILGGSLLSKSAAPIVVAIVILTAFSRIWLVAINILAFKVMYGSSTRATLALGIFMYVVFTLFGLPPIPGAG